MMFLINEFTTTTISSYLQIKDKPGGYIVYAYSRIASIEYALTFPVLPFVSKIKISGFDNNVFSK